jgi:hypothetical protein
MQQQAAGSVSASRKHRKWKAEPRRFLTGLQKIIVRLFFLSSLPLSK